MCIKWVNEDKNIINVLCYTVNFITIKMGVDKYENLLINSTT